MVLNDIVGVVNIGGAGILFYLLVADREAIPTTWKIILTILALGQWYSGAALIFPHFVLAAR